MINDTAVSKARRVRLLVLDVDGVLTGGQIVFGRDGETAKIFHSRDGLGIALAGRAGLKTAIITGRETDMVRLRGAELKIADIYQGVMNKAEALTELAARHGLSLEEVAYVGDDLNDLPALTRAGFPCTVADAVPEVRSRAAYIAGQAGGNGAVREIIEFILKARGEWDQVVDFFINMDGTEIKQ